MRHMIKSSSLPPCFSREEPKYKANLNLFIIYFVCNHMLWSVMLQCWDNLADLSKLAQNQEINYAAASLLHK